MLSNVLQGVFHWMNESECTGLYRILRPWHPRQREEMQQALMKLSSDLKWTFLFQLDNMYRRMRRLICFDMDSTLIQTECIDELAERAGVGDQVMRNHRTRHAWK